ncbi:MAG: DUF3320 domain-containing protein [Clostridiales bacterium]|jgi:hypothetical protein|nr:DUF3320 domain-containing protein [Clostridiales bacterium]
MEKSDQADIAEALRGADAHSGGENVFQKADPVVTLEYAKRVCFVMQQNGADAVHALSVLNNTQTEMRELRFKITSSPAFFEPVYLSLDTLPPGESYVFGAVRTVLDYDYLSALSERVRTELSVECEIGGVAVKREVVETDVLAFDEWPGYNAMPELLAAFSTPRDPEVNGIVSQAAQLLKAEGLAFNGYQSGDPNVVNKQLSALYAAVKSRNIAYCMPPAGFEQQGQKLRLPGAVIGLGLGTCLDTTMLFCSCAEAVGLNPVVFIYHGHAFAGFWLTDSTFPECINDDLSLVKKWMAGGMSRLTALETTCVTENTAGFLDAQNAAKERLDDGGGFLCYIDIARARKSGILPLPVRYEKDGRYFIDRALSEAAAEAVGELRVIDVDTKGQAPEDRFSKWKRDLLDITLKNPLVNYRINRAGVPLLNYDLEAVEDAFAEGASLGVGAHPNELTKPITDITGLCVENDPQLSAVLKGELAAERLRSSLREEDLTKRLTTLYRSARQSLEENGAGTLYLALGFLKWQERDKPTVNRYSPIILLPMEMVRRSARAGYVVRMTEDEHRINLSLIEMLRVNFKIDATALTNIPEGEKGIDVAKLLTLLRKLIIDQKGWDVVEAASLGLFHFSKFVLWNDLNLREEAVRKHPLTGSLISGVNDPRLYAASPDEGDLRLYLPLDSDSSQTKAALEAARGRTFVLHGPPGTGKSQTITNIIANAVAHNKRVLFVAEKLAALNVVKRRLEKLGLFDFCLELHSNKSQKKNFYEQFDRLPELSKSATDAGFSVAAQKLAQSAAELEDFNAAMHAARRNGVSVFEGIDRIVKLGDGEDAPLSVAEVDILPGSYEEGLENLKRLTDMGAILGEPVNAPFYGCEAAEYSLDLRDTVVTLSKRLSDAYAGFAAAAGGLAEVLASRKAAVNILSYPILSGVFDTLSELLFYRDKNGFVRFFLRVFSKRYKTLCKSPYYKSLKKFVKEKPEEAALIFDSLAAFLSAERELGAALLYGGKFETAEDYGLEVYSAARQYLYGIATLRDTCAYNEYRKRCAAYPQLNEVVAQYHAGGLASPDVPRLFERSFWRCWLHKAVSEDPVLRRFSPGAYAAGRERFKALTDYVAGITQKEVFLKLAANLPNFQYASMSGAEPGILLKAVKSRGRGLTIRQLMRRIPDLMSKVKPCMLMSPLSAAQYLPEDYPPFDIVVFDEASQLLTSEAVGAIARGRSAVVVGDPNQLPPTTFFSAKADEAETDFEMQDLESILDDMLTLGIMENRLLWHYRSEHESLIAFSNAKYYDNRLITFPSPDDVKSRVQFRKVDGVYERGSTRTNPREAEAVVDELFACLRHPEKSRQSYGVVTFNVNQQTLIEDMIDKRLAKEPSFEKFFNGGDSPVFVKNIESVQGDERDVIFFSVTYGLDREGKMTVNFGPVNREGGWRRLNVAITRACKRIVVFSTVTPDRIDVSRTAAKGVKGLKDFMNYAVNCRTYFKRADEGTAESELVRSVAKALTDAGYRAGANTGRSDNKIDVAVQDDNGNYILGVLCDTKNAALSGVRDREYGRESVLKRLGWKLTRVYALEWWQNPKEETRRLLGILAGGAVENTGETAEAITRELREAQREIAFDPAVKPPVREYARADLPQNTPDNFYLYNNAGLIAEQVRRVVAVEGPVARPRLHKTIAEAWGIRRMTQKFTEYLDHLIKRQKFFIGMTQGVGFLSVNREQADIKYYRVPSDRKADEISKEEYAAAAYYIMQNALSIGQADLVRETAKLFGFIKTPTAEIRIHYALSLLTAQGRIRSEGELYKLKTG